MKKGTNWAISCALLWTTKPNSESESPEIVWQENQLSPATASPFVYDGKVYTVNSSGALACADAKDGKRLWQLRLTGPFSGSPVGVGGKIYFFNESGQGQVVEPGAKSGEVVDQHNFEDTFLCTPAVSDGAIYIRSDQTLYKIASREKTKSVSPLTRSRAIWLMF
jgi:outer membrane protein assembly factor BamB